MSFVQERDTILGHFVEEWLGSDGFPFVDELRNAADIPEDARNQPPPWFPEELNNRTEHLNKTALYRIAFDNRNFMVPQQNLENPKSCVWVRITILPAGANQLTLGRLPLVTHSGVLTIQIFHPEKTNPYGVTEEIADVVSKIFSLKTVQLIDGDRTGHIRFRQAQLIRIGSEGDNWYQQNVTIVYERQTTDTPQVTVLDIIYGRLNIAGDEFLENSRGINVGSSGNVRILFPPVNEQYPRWAFRFEQTYGSLLALPDDDDGNSGNVLNRAINNTSFNEQWDSITLNGETLFVSPKHGLPGARIDVEFSAVESG